MKEWHPIRVVARRTGLTPHVIRAWEKRYGALTPRRTETNRRLYSQEDLERLLLLRRATLTGRSIGQVASVETDELRRLVEEDEAAQRAVSQPTSDAPRPATDAASSLPALFEAVEGLDASELQRELDRAAVAMSRPLLVKDVLVPLMHRLGDEWRDGSIRVAHEHLASAVVRTFVANLNGAVIGPSEAPRIIVTTPNGQHHEIGALLAAATALSEGWIATYLGPNLPADEIVGAARQCRARAVALSVVYPGDDPHLVSELKKVATYLPGETRLLVGGRVAAHYQELLEGIGATYLPSFDALAHELEAIRMR